MIETAEAVANLEEIVRTPGLDGVYIGPADLTLGVMQGALPPGFDREEPEMLEVIHRILRAAKGAGIRAGIHCGTPEYAARAIGWGFDLTTVGMDTRLLATSAATILAKVRQLLAADGGAPSRSPPRSVGPPATAAAARRRRVGLVGYGAVGRYLARAIQQDPVCRERLELAFVCNPRTPSVVRDDPSLPVGVALDALADFASRGADLIVEVAHPTISEQYGAQFLEHADYLPSSVTAFANAETERAMREASESGQGHGIYIPSGALWGARDIQNMAHRGNLGGLTVTMKKAPHHLKLQAPLSHKLDEVVASGATGETVLFEGPCRELAPLAPNNTNTIAAAALAAHTLGMDGTIGRLVCDPSLEAHIVEVEVTGAANPGAPAFRCVTQRINPAAKGAVTGDATYASFMSSMLDAGGRGGGLHFC